MKTSDKATPRTISRRNNYLASQFASVSGDNDSALSVQTSKLLKSFDQTDRKDILVQAGLVAPEIDAGKMVAMKVDLGIPWEKLKTMAKY